MPEESDTLKVSLIADATELDKTVKQREQRLKQFRKLANREAQVRFTATVAELQQKIDEARKRLRDYKKNGEKDAIIKTRLEILGLQRGVTQARKGLREVQKEAERTGNSFFKLTGLVKDFIKGFLGVSLITRGIQFFRDSRESFLEFESGLANVSTLIQGDATNAIQGYRKEISKLIREIPKDANDLGSGLYQVLSAGITDAADATKVLEESAKAAVAGVSDTNSSVDAVTTVLNAYKLSAEQAQKVTDSFFVTIREGKITFPELAQNIGKVAATAALGNVSIEEIGASVATLTKNGINAEKAFVALNRLLLQIVNPSAELADKARQVGLEFSASALQAKGFSKFLAELTSLSEENQNALFELGFDVQSFRAAAILAGTGAQEFSKQLKNQASAAGAAQEAFDKQARSEKNLRQIQRQRTEELKRSIGALLNSIILPITEAFLDFAENVRDAIGLFSEFKPVVIALKIALAGLISVVSTLAIVFAPIPALIIGATAVVTKFLKNFVVETEEMKRSIETVSESLARLNQNTVIAEASFKKLAIANRENERTFGDSKIATDAYNEALEELIKQQERIGNKSGLTKKEIEDFQGSLRETGRDTEETAKKFSEFVEFSSNRAEDLANTSENIFNRILRAQETVNFNAALKETQDYVNASDEAFQEVIKELTRRSVEAGDIGKAFSINIGNGLTSAEAIRRLIDAGATTTEIVNNKIIRDGTKELFTSGIALARAFRSGFLQTFKPALDGIKRSLRSLLPALDALGIDSQKVGNKISSIGVSIKDFLEQNIKSAKDVENSLSSKKTINTIEILNSRLSLLQSQLKKTEIGTNEFNDLSKQIGEVQTEIDKANDIVGKFGGASKNSAGSAIDSQKDIENQTKSFTSSLEKAEDKYIDLTDEIEKRSSDLADDVEDFYEDITVSINKAVEKQNELNSSLEDFKADENQKLVNDLAERDIELKEDQVDLQERLNNLNEEAVDLEKARKKKAFGEGLTDEEAVRFGREKEDINNEILETTQKIKDAEAERAQITEFINNQSKEALDRFNAQQELLGKTDTERAIIASEEAIKKKEEEVQAEIEKQQRIIDIQKQFQNLSTDQLSKFQDERGRIDKEKLASFLKEQGIQDLNEQEKIEALKLANKLLELEQERIAVTQLEQELFNVKKQFFQDFQDVFNEGIDAQKQKTQELIDLIKDAQIQQEKLNDLGGVSTSSAGTTNTTNKTINVNQSVNGNVDLDAANKQLLRKA